MKRDDKLWVGKTAMVGFLTPDGEAFEVEMKPGIVPLAQYFDMLGDVELVLPKGVKLIEAHLRAGTVQPVEAFDTGANQDFVPREQDRVQRLEALVGRLVMDNQSMAARVSSASRDQMPVAKPEEVQVVEPAETAKKPE